MYRFLNLLLALSFTISFTLTSNANKQRKPANIALKSQLERLPSLNNNEPSSVCESLIGNPSVWYGRTYKFGQGRRTSFIWKVSLSAEDISKFGTKKDIAAFETWKNINKMQDKELPTFECHYRADTKRFFEPPRNLEESHYLISKSKNVNKHFVSQEKVINKLSFQAKAYESSLVIATVAGWGGCAAIGTFATGAATASSAGAASPTIPMVLAGCGVLANFIRSVPKGFGTDSSFGTKNAIDLAQNHARVYSDTTSPLRVEGTAIDKVTSTVRALSRRKVRALGGGAKLIPKYLNIECPKPEALMK